MIETYNTILQEGQDEIVEKKSRFIGYAVPVSSEEEAYAFVREDQEQLWIREAQLLCICHRQREYIADSDENRRERLKLIGGGYHRKCSG